MFLPKRHLLAIFQSNPIRHSVRVVRNAPKCAVFDFGDLEVDCFGTLVTGVLYDDANDAGRKEVTEYLGGKDDAGPVGKGVLGDWGEETWHGCGSEVCYGER